MRRPVGQMLKYTPPAHLRSGCDRHHMQTAAYRSTVLFSFFLNRKTIEKAQPTVHMLVSTGIDGTTGGTRAETHQRDTHARPGRIKAVVKTDMVSIPR